MVEMSMNKVIHAAVRRDLDRFADALTTFRPGNTERAEGLARAWDNFDHQLTDHHESEHEIVWPALELLEVPRATLDQMDAEHAEMAAALEQARVLMHRLTVEPTEEVRTGTLAALERLREVTVAHLDHEEQEMESLFLEKRDSAEIKEMMKKLDREGGLAEGGGVLRVGARRLRTSRARRPRGRSPEGGAGDPHRRPSAAATAGTSRRSGPPDQRGSWSPLRHSGQMHVLGSALALEEASQLGTLAAMWRRLRERLFNAVGIVVVIAWLFAAVLIAAGPLGVEPQRSNLWVVALIFLAPGAVMICVDELVHRIKYGPTKPGRHSSGVLDLDTLRKLDGDLKRRGDSSES